MRKISSFFSPVVVGAAKLPVDLAVYDGCINVDYHNRGLFTKPDLDAGKASRGEDVLMYFKPQ
jgi:hypothetical protein